jgi:hypothetical protein
MLFWVLASRLQILFPARVFVYLLSNWNTSFMSVSILSSSFLFRSFNDFFPYLKVNVHRVVVRSSAFFFSFFGSSPPFLNAVLFVPRQSYLPKALARPATCPWAAAGRRPPPPGSRPSPSG